MRFKTLILIAICLLACTTARAEKWALLIGINHYEDANSIASLGAADTDARELKKTLKSQLGFPEANITLLVSDGDKKPTRANILEALGELGENAKPGDTVFVFYSGHGIEVGGKACLLPHDFRGKSKFAGVETALEVAKFKELLGEVKAKALIMVWDMCRNDPFAKGKGGNGERNVLKDAKGWGIVPAGATRGVDGPVVANFFACSSGETSFEWTDKNRGYFAYFLEQGMKGEAADASGNITLGGLAKYVQTRVATITKSNEGQAQNPFPEFGGSGANDYVLATGKANPNAETAATTKPLVGGGVKTLSTRATLTFSGQPAGASILVDKVPVKGGSWSTSFVEATKDVEVAITARGFDPKVVVVTLERGKTTPVDASLTNSATEKPADPMPDPTNNNAAPPPSSASEQVKQILANHRVDELFALPAYRFTQGAAMEKYDLGATFKYQSPAIVIHPATARFRIEYVNTKKIRAGFDGQHYWRQEAGKPVAVTDGEQYANNPCQFLWYALRSLPSMKVSGVKPTKDKNGTIVLATDERMPGATFTISVGKDGLISRIQVMLAGDELSFSFDKYERIGSAPVPSTFRFVESKQGIRQINYIYTMGTPEPNSPNKSDGYFKGGF